MHDPQIYANPMTFEPARFLGETPELDPRKICFGFGRRSVYFSNLWMYSNLIHILLVSVQVSCYSLICHVHIAYFTFSGLLLADASVFISVAMSLAVFDISKHVENGIVDEPVHENLEGTIRHDRKQLRVESNADCRSAVTRNHSSALLQPAPTKHWLSSR